MKPHYKLVRADRVKPGDNILCMGFKCTVRSVETYGGQTFIVMHGMGAVTVMNGWGAVMRSGWTHQYFNNDDYVAVRGAK